jgi:acyl-CoA reductase-like NAD-dependent aldehyde dehydrogenase
MPQSVTEQLYQIEALGPSKPYRARNPKVITDVTGHPVAALSMVPLPFVSRAMAALRKATTTPHEARLEAIARAGEAFLHDTVAGLSAAEYQHMVARISGLGITEVRSAAEKIADHAAKAWDLAQFARPAGVAASGTDPAVKTGAGLWIRRGDVFSVHAAGNHPAIHGGWLEALALGYRIAVRPSRREPLTPHRLISALRDAGFSADQVVLLPTEYDAADEMINACDLAMVYGGQAVIDKYRDANLLPQGPGRSKILITSEVDWRDQVDLVVDSVSRGGGTGCTNATSVLLEGDESVAAAFAEAVAARLATIPSLPPQDEAAVLPVHAIDDARRIEDFLRQAARGTTAVLGSDGIVDDLGDGSAALRPAVHLVSTAEGVQTSGVELAFPCLWVAPWTRDNGAMPLRNTLNLVIMGRDEALIDAALDDRSIRNVYVGELPSYFSRPNMPHDGYLAEFLMKAKGFVRYSRP